MLITWQANGLSEIDACLNRERLEILARILAQGEKAKGVEEARPTAAACNSNGKRAAPEAEDSGRPACVVELGTQGEALGRPSTPSRSGAQENMCSSPRVCAGSSTSMTTPEETVLGQQVWHLRMQIGIDRLFFLFFPFVPSDAMLGDNRYVCRYYESVVIWMLSFRPCGICRWPEICPPVIYVRKPVIGFKTLRSWISFWVIT